MSPAVVIDKPVYSPFANPQLAELLRQRVVLPVDALCSSPGETHDLMRLYHRRFSQQIETAETETILASWA